MKYWETPGGTAYKLYLDLLQEDTVLLAGARGTGKSVMIHGMIYTALYKSPEQVGFVLIDPKIVELARYERLPHVIYYADSIPKAIQALQKTVDLMYSRYSYMKRTGQTQSEERPIYVVIDEYADLKLKGGKDAENLIIELALLGRAANIHLVVATQRPTRDVINGAIKVNMECRVALHCPEPQDSRNIIGKTGAEKLPKYGQCIKVNTEGTQNEDVPMYSQEDLQERVQWWTRQRLRVLAR